MSIQVFDLTKQYDDQIAVQSMSFELQKGEVLGFLGPNGAGKSTTMKMLTGSVIPTSGYAEVCGFNVLTHSMEVRKRIGYLPEHNPLYPDLYVGESLEFVCRLHGIASKLKKDRIAEVIELTGLTQEKHKKVVQLSKGYKQRLGLAQAILHKPEVLILDEPTSGLDPNQLVEVRTLIRNLAKDTTVILSSHILQEVEAICDSILIIAKGEKKAFGKKAEIQSILKAGIAIRIETASKQYDWLSNLTGIVSKRLDGNACIIEAKTDIRTQIAQAASNQQEVILHISLLERGLEDIFRTLTQQV